MTSAPVHRYGYSLCLTDHVVSTSRTSAPHQSQQDRCRRLMRRAGRTVSWRTPSLAAPSVRIHNVVVVAMGHRYDCVRPYDVVRQSSLCRVASVLPLCLACLVFSLQQFVTYDVRTFISTAKRKVTFRNVQEIFELIERRINELKSCIGSYLPTL